MEKQKRFWNMRLYEDNIDGVWLLGPYIESCGNESSKYSKGTSQLHHKRYLFNIYFIDYTITDFPFFLPFIPLYPAPLPPAFLPLSSCWSVVHISSLVSSFPILFLTSPYFVPTNYSSYSPYLFPILPFPTDNPPCDLHFCDSVPVLVVA